MLASQHSCRRRRRWQSWPPPQHCHAEHAAPAQARPAAKLLPRAHHSRPCTGGHLQAATHCSLPAAVCDTLCLPARRSAARVAMRGSGAARHREQLQERTCSSTKSLLADVCCLGSAADPVMMARVSTPVSTNAAYAERLALQGTAFAKREQQGQEQWLLLCPYKEVPSGATSGSQQPQCKVRAAALRHSQTHCQVAT